MCIHDESSLDRVIRECYEGMEVVMLRDTSGKMVGAALCDPNSAQSVANAARNVKAWHGHEGSVLDFSRVNRKRGLYPLISEETLPPPDEQVPPSRDSISRAMV